MPIFQRVSVRIAKLLLLLLLASFCSTFSYGAAADRITGSLTSGRTVTLEGHLARRALPQFDQGPIDPATRLDMITLIASPTAVQQKALTQLLAQQQDPKSLNYHRWLTPEQYADRFGLSRNDAQQIAAWLKAQGFSEIHVARGRNWVSFSGTAAQVQSSFSTEIHNYNVNGEMHYANATAPAIPAALAGIVTGLRGLHDFYPKPMGIGRNAEMRPYYDSSVYGDLVAPGDIATIYDINALYSAGIDGTGETLAVMGQTDIYLADIADFRSGFGLPAIACTTNGEGVITACNDPHFQYVLNGPDPGLSTKGDIKEADLDLEWAGAVARGAQLIYVNSSNTLASYYYSIDNDLAPVISLSYGECESDDNDIAGDETELQTANSEGITFVNASGDSGAAECDYFATVTSGNLATQGLAVSYPASSPEVTGVGGTAIPFTDLTGTYWGTSNGTFGGTALSYIPEQAWNDDLEFAQYCVPNANTDYCKQGGSTAHSGWVPITSEATAQTDISIASSGGGASNCAFLNHAGQCFAGFTQPSWQTVTVPSQASARFSPDVSFLSTPNFPGYIICTQLSELGLSGSGSSCAPGGTAGITDALNLDARSISGGTSISTPLFAGIVALLNQYLAGASSPGLGNVNPTLYALAETPSNKAFHPVTTGDNNVYCEVGTPSSEPSGIQCPGSGVFGFAASNADATTGYNLVTGLGSVDVNNLALAWAASRSSSSVSLGATPSQPYQSESVTLTATTTPSTAIGNVTFNNGATVLGTASLSTGTASLVISTLPVAANSITATYNGDGGLSSSTSSAVTVTVVPAFTLSSSAGTVTVNPGQSGSATITVAQASGFSGALTFSCSGLPSGASCTFTPNGTTHASVALTIATAASTPGGSTPITITATTGGSSPLTNTTQITLAVEEFTLSANSSTITVVAGQSGSSNITVAPANGFSQALTFSCSGLPSGATCAFTPNGTTQTTVALSVATTASMGASSGSISITATTSGSNPSTNTAQITLTVTPGPSFAIAAGATSYQVKQGQSVTATVMMTGSNGFNSSVTYTCTDPASESTCTGPSAATTAASVTFNITTTAPTSAALVPFNTGMRVFYAALLPGLGIVFAAKPRRRWLRGMRLLSLILMLGFSTAWLASCGGGSGGGESGTPNPGTPTGSYTITVNATAGGTAPSSGPVTFTLAVQ